MAIIIDGLAIARKHKEAMRAELQKYATVRRPHLFVLLVGEDPASSIYVANKVKACEFVGITSSVKRLPLTASQQEVEYVLRSANENTEIDAILVQLPLPEHLDAEKILFLLRPDKDADGLHPMNLGMLVHDTPLVLPCTPSGILVLLQEYGISTTSKHIVIVGRSVIVGKTMALALLRNTTMGNATVTVCHSKTTNLLDQTKEADILIVAMGRPHSITASMVKEHSTIIDVGINRTPLGLQGDCAFDELHKKVYAITPVPKGVGPMTICQLLQNTITLWKQHHMLA